MLRRVTNAMMRRRKVVYVVAALLVPILGIFGGGVEEELSAGGFIVESSESARAERLLEEEFGAGPTDWVLVLSLTADNRVTDDDVVAAGLALSAEIEREPGVTDTISFWTFGDVPPPALSPLRSVDGRFAIVAASLSGDEDTKRDTAVRLEEFTTDTELWAATTTGSSEVSRQAREQAESDLVRSELIAAPLTLIALLLVFRGFRPALLPLVVAIFAVLGTFSVLRVIASITTVSVFALNLTTALGLGLAIDYSLLIVARFREELAAGHPTEAALQRTVQTAGRTVMFSGATVAASLTALLVFPAAYLRSFAFAGVAVVTVAVAASLLLLPALLMGLGDQIGSKARHGGGFWRAQTSRVIRHPALWATAVTVVLVVVGLPFLGFDAGRIDDRVLPADNPARVGAELVREEFAFREFNGIGVVLPGMEATEEALTEVKDELLAMPNVSRVDSPLGFFRQDSTTPPKEFNERFESDAGVWFRVISDSDPDHPRTTELLDALRLYETDRADAVLLTGTTASVDDTVDAVVDRLPVALVIIAAITLLVLYLMTGSVVVPVKAVVLNLLSLTATFGALVWIFQDGNLAGALDVTPTGTIDVYTPVLMFCVAFGLSMDYEVFLISRIKEEYDLSGDNDKAVVDGIASTGHIVTAAAVLLAIVFVSIATSGVAIVKMFGVGLTIAVIVDAFLVRATLTPALMKAAGRLNWWAPGPLRRFHLRWGIWENEPITLPHAEQTTTPQED